MSDISNKIIADGRLDKIVASYVVKEEEILQNSVGLEPSFRIDTPYCGPSVGKEKPQEDYRLQLERELKTLQEEVFWLELEKERSDLDFADDTHNLISNDGGIWDERHFLRQRLEELKAFRTRNMSKKKYTEGVLERHRKEDLLSLYELALDFLEKTIASYMFNNPLVRIKVLRELIYQKEQELIWFATYNNEDVFNTGTESPAVDCHQNNDSLYEQGERLCQDPYFLSLINAIGTYNEGRDGQSYRRVRDAETPK